VYLLGLVDFDDAQALQRRLVYELGDGGGGALVLCEHPPTITVGRTGSRIHIRPDDDELREQGIRVRWVNRGGGCVLHTPGQLVAYLTLPLDRHGLTVQGYLDALHEVVLEVLLDFDLKGQINSNLSGVFLGGARVASVGIAVTRWIAYHGLTLNVGPYLAHFLDVLSEPGTAGMPLHQTSMEARRQRPAPMSRVRESVIRHVSEVFAFPYHHLYTDHPLLRRKVRADVFAPSLP
jgi:lipoyl(octanoyl) transferase